MARHRADAARAGQGRYRAALNKILSAGRDPQRTAERAEHAVELLAAAQDMTGGRDHAKGTLAAALFRVFLDPVDRNFAGAAKNRKYRAIFQKIDCVITPLAGGDLAAIKAKNAVELPPAESHFACGGVRTLLAPAPPAWIDLAEIHTAPPSVMRTLRSLHDRAGTDRGQAFLRRILGVKNGAAALKPGANKTISAAQVRHF